MDTIPAVVDDRALYVKRRILAIGEAAATLVLEAGTLLTEYKANAYWREDGYPSFDVAIDTMQSNGQIDFGSRQARNLISVVEMFTKLGIPETKRRELGISKLREVASLHDEKEQRKLLDAASGMSVAEVQREAKRLRYLASGRDVDPLDPIVIQASTTQRQFYGECIDAARHQYGIDDHVPEATVLVDTILAEWHSGLAHEQDAV